MIPIFSNTLGQEELDAIAETFKTRWIGKGKQCDNFEKEFAGHLAVPEQKVLLHNCCTATIYNGLKAIGIGKGDEVIISTSNFVACANAVIDLGATPVFADIDLRTLNILPDEIARLKSGKTRAVLLLHYGGHPARMDDIQDVCGNDIHIVEDSANSVSSSYKGRMCGTFGAAGFWSFDAMKILVMIDGGALYLRDEEALEKAISLRYLGLAPKTTSGMDALQDKQSRWWEYDLALTSGRFVSNDVLASIGRVQLRKLPSFVERRKQIWAYYQQELQNCTPIKCPPEPIDGAETSYYLYWIQAEEKRDELAVYLADNGVYTTYRYYPLHMVEYYNANSRLPNAEKANEITLNIPLHQNLSDGEAERVVDLVKKFFK